MPELTTLLVFVAAAVALLVVPGPAVLYIVARSAAQGRAAGLASVAGIHTGTLVHVAASAVGLSALLVSSALAYSAVKWAGAVYLIVLGLRRLLGTRAEAQPRVPPPQPLWWIFRDGVLVNVLNPKTALFFLSLLPQFIQPARGAAAAQAVLLGLLFVGIGLLTDGLYAVAGAAAGDRVRRNPRLSTRLDRIGATVYIGLGALALAGDDPPRR